MTSLRTVASLIIALTIVQLSQGLLGVHLPLAMAASGFTQSWVGMAAAAYSLGFMGGAYLGPVYLARIGNIRVFAAAAAIATAAVLGLNWAHGFFLWMTNRFAMGAALALIFAAGESWMNVAIGKSERGGVIGFYMVCTKAALALGPFLVIGVAPRAPEPLMIAAMLMALAMAPICFTSQAEPEPPISQMLKIDEQFRTAPAAVIACFGSGFINAGVLAIAPLYAQARYGIEAAALFQSAAWVGSLIVQYPAGRVSDRIDRRVVIAGLLGVAGAAAIALAITNGKIGFVPATILFAIWGSCQLSFYGVAVAHMADRAEPGQMARATAGLLFVWGAGSVLGPALLGVLADALGDWIVFWYAGILGWLLAGAMLMRRAARSEPERAKTPFANEPATSVAAADLAYGESEGVKTEA